MFFCEETKQTSRSPLLWLWETVNKLLQRQTTTGEGGEKDNRDTVELVEFGDLELGTYCLDSHTRTHAGQVRDWANGNDQLRNSFHSN